MRANTLETGLTLIFVTTAKIRNHISFLLVVEAPMPRVTQACDRAAAPASFLPGDQIARILSAGGALQIEIYDAPVANGSADAVAGLRETMTTAQAAGQPAYGSLAKLPVRSIAVVKPGGILGPTHYGHWQDEDIPVSFTALSNGDETKIFVFSRNGNALPAGNYTLKLSLDRDRWSVSPEADPEQHYHDERAIAMQCESKTSGPLIVVSSDSGRMGGH
jgi:hypothetical protein